MGFCCDVRGKDFAHQVSLIISAYNQYTRTKGNRDANRYWSDLKRNLLAENYDQVYEKIVRLKMLTPEMREKDYGRSDSTCSSFNKLHR